MHPPNADYSRGLSGLGHSYFRSLRLRGWTLAEGDVVVRDVDRRVIESEMILLKHLERPCGPLRLWYS